MDTINYMIDKDIYTRKKKKTKKQKHTHTLIFCMSYVGSRSMNMHACWILIYAWWSMIEIKYIFNIALQDRMILCYNMYFYCMLYNAKKWKIKSSNMHFNIYIYIIVYYMYIRILCILIWFWSDFVGRCCDASISKWMDNNAW